MSTKTLVENFRKYISEETMGDDGKPLVDPFVIKQIEIMETHIRERLQELDPQLAETLLKGLKTLNQMLGVRDASENIKEYGASHGRVSWSENESFEMVFDIEGVGEGLTKSQVYDIMNDPSTDEELANEIRAAVEDSNDYDEY